MVDLREITILSDNVKDCVELDLPPEQWKFVAHNAVSLGQAYVTNKNGLGSKAVSYSIHAEGRMVGFIMYGFFKPEYDDEYGIGKDYYYFWRFMVDEKYQGKGYGKAAMTQVIDEIKQKPCGDAEVCVISYTPGNPAKGLYESLGFVETGEIVDGEAVAHLSL